MEPIVAIHRVCALHYTWSLSELTVSIFQSRCMGCLEYLRFWRLLLLPLCLFWRQKVRYLLNQAESGLSKQPWLNQVDWSVNPLFPDTGLRRACCRGTNGCSLWLYFNLTLLIVE